jgi:hypothetical protein
VHADGLGMFDWSQLEDSRACVVCGETLTEWQGTDGPCGPFVWRQGCRGPVGQRVDDEVALAPEDRELRILPTDL